MTETRMNAQRNALPVTASNHQQSGKRPKSSEPRFTRRLKEFRRERRGVREWAPTQMKIIIGCPHRCLYCYARNYALRFGDVKRSEDWVEERLRSKLPRICRFKGRVMFPSAHDITPRHLPDVIARLKALVEKGNKVLVVSKPHLDCITRICEELAACKKQILFRFTIGTLDECLAKFWEPGAPTPAERIACLKHAFSHGFQTSVSMEPMLAGTEDAIQTFRALIPLVTETVWIGKMNHVRQYVDRSSLEIKAACRRITTLQSDTEILRLVKALGQYPQVKWKDSIRAVVRSCRRRLHASSQTGDKSID